MKLKSIDPATRNAWLITETGLHWISEHKFCDTRKWRADHACESLRVIIEVDGGNWTNGRHNRGKGKEADNVKLNTAAALGWYVLRYSTAQFASGSWIEELAAIRLRVERPF